MESQFKKGLIELCVLKALADKECYGYELIESVSNIISITKGTLYPLLRRLQKEGYLDYYIKESELGPARKYYKITPLGLNRFIENRSEWLNIADSVTNFLKGDKGYE
ncbi:PadR family transcriptional regulator [Romboutsia sp. MSSM.1001216sp_RTP31141st1_G3_RTP31141_220114]|uniref:PadR family transcriptional regulator n=1 Tax=unclassified Romboutsia TaxID=2626894 RepID=UPI0031B61C8D